MNKKIVLIVIIVLCLSIFTGCQKQPPEGVSQEFYDDMIDASEGLISSIRTAKNTDIIYGDIALSTFDVLEKYISKTDDLTLTERAVYESFFKLYHSVTTHYDGSPKEDEITENAETFSKLMEIDIDIDEILLK